MKRVLISTLGSHGDLLPFIALAQTFASHGHEPILYTNPFFRECVEAAGISFVPVGTVEQFTSALALTDANATQNQLRAFRPIAAELSARCRDYYQAMKRDVVPKQSIAIGHAFMFAHRLLRETHQVPCATAHLQPILLRSNERPPRNTAASSGFGQLTPLGPLTPRFVTQTLWWLADKTFFHVLFTRSLNQLRTELGLPVVKRAFHAWIHEADCVLGLFPDWFVKPPADWPSQLTLTGFPLHDNAAQRPLSPQLLQFLEAGPPPVAFYAGPFIATTRDFFEASVQAVQHMDRRAILLAQFAKELPANLPKNVIHVDHAPFGALLPRLSAFVHHGGIGTTAQALRAGVPQLIRPVAYDQFDNSAHTLKLGVARELLVKKYTAPAVARVLTEMLGNKALHEQCRQVAKHFEEGGCPMEAAYEAICKRLC